MSHASWFKGVIIEKEANTLTSRVDCVIWVSVPSGHTEADGTLRLSLDVFVRGVGISQKKECDHLHIYKHLSLGEMIMQTN